MSSTTLKFCTDNDLPTTNYVLATVCKRKSLYFSGTKQTLLNRLDEYFKDHPDELVKELFLKSGGLRDSKTSKPEAQRVSKPEAQRVSKLDKFIKDFERWRPLFIEKIKMLDEDALDIVITQFEPMLELCVALKKIYNKSPLRYPGGKTKARKILGDIFKEHFDVESINTAYSPFFGGGSFEFFLQGEYGYRIVANDKFTPLYNFWKVCATEKKELCDELSNKPTITKEEFTDYRDKIMKETGVVQAFQYFVINRCSFSGATLSGGFSEESSKKRYTKSSIERVSKLDLSHFEIHNKDFADFMRSCEGFLYLDPPYHIDSKLYGNKGDMHESFDHAKLHNILKNKKSWMMTYNDCKYIRDLYKDYKIIDAAWTYGMNKTKKSSEIIIVSP